MPVSFRSTTQALLPARPAPAPAGQYDIYPAFPCEPGAIALGYDALAERLVGARQVTLDGYGGVLWDELRLRLTEALARRGLTAAWRSVDEALRPLAEIEALVTPFLGGDDPLFGTRFTGRLRDFFDAERLARLKPDPGANLSIIYGCGAALCGWDGLLVYVDLPKNEIQFRARAGTVRNLGAAASASPKEMYKRFYFVDWVALNKHKAELAARVDLVVDAQRPDEPTLMAGSDLRAALAAMSRNFFRVRPWFEPGPWGGQWIKAHIPQLPQSAPNYAWSFELIAPENGLLLGGDGLVLEVAFDWLMICAHEEVLGRAAARFGLEFPIRFDFLDTFSGGNLSVQCHPRPEYIRRHFGESFTQDETYYILDCAPGAEVYLGFCDDAEPAEFRAALERSYHEATPLEVDRFVQRVPAHRHDLFLIPNGTIHCSGANNLVLEISATPYIFTFKMYDWLRLDLDGRPRPLNIARACENLYFERRGARVSAELISRPRLAGAGEGWQCFDLPTHPEHFYAVRRYEFHDRVRIETRGACHVMSLVEGTSITLETAAGRRQRFNYAETFVVPAAAESYTLINHGPQLAKVVQSFVKDSAL
jgi:mannose-6-phosphate isomerase class I